VRVDFSCCVGSHLVFLVQSLTKQNYKHAFVLFQCFAVVVFSNGWVGRCRCLWRPLLAVTTLTHPPPFLSPFTYTTMTDNDFLGLEVMQRPENNSSAGSKP
jgi:hypothetical protein